MAITEESIIGRKIRDVRLLSDEEMKRLGWYGERSAVIILDDGTKLYASSDYEGNDSGAIFGTDDEEDFILRPTLTEKEVLKYIKDIWGTDQLNELNQAVINNIKENASEGYPLDIEALKLLKKKNIVQE